MVKEFVNVNLQIKFNNFTIFNNWLNSNVNEVLQNLPLTKLIFISKFEDLRFNSNVNEVLQNLPLTK